MRILPLFLFLFLAACGTDPQVLTDYDATVASMLALVDDHAAISAELTSLDEVDAPEADYQSAWAGLSQEASDEMTEMGGCTMAHGKAGAEATMGMMDDAESTQAMMDQDMTLHMADHSDHTEIAECQSEESDHLGLMHTMLADMSSYSDEWRNDRMSCPSRPE